MPKRKIHWRILYYAAWLVPAMIASFANYAVSAETNPDVAWLRYAQIHFFYWLAWGVIAEIAYLASPQYLHLGGPRLPRFVVRHGLIVVGVILYFSIYYWLINRSQFADAASPSIFLEAMYLRGGPLMFHVMNVVTYVIVLGACLIIRQAHYAREQEEQRIQLELRSQRLETSLAESKLATLTNQVHPHFLFNAMNNIASLISAGQAHDAYRAVTLLAGLLRKTFQYVRQRTITVQEEIDLVKTMMNIGELRFEERFSWSVRLPPSLAGVHVPPFLIQPLAENALRHGVEATTGRVRIDIDVFAAAGMLVMAVEDDGPGIQGSATGGLGLQNLRERLLLAHDEAELAVAAPPNGGFRVEVRLPMESVDAC